eukprot:scaffold25843_cov55-Phaeocystis_antarctica.AAC.1
MARLVPDRPAHAERRDAAHGPAGRPHHGDQGRHLSWPRLAEAGRGWPRLAEAGGRPALDLELAGRIKTGGRMGRSILGGALSTWGGTVTTATPTVTAVPAAMPNLACQLR